MNFGVYHGIILDLAFEDSNFPETFKIFAKRKSTKNPWTLIGVEIDKKDLSKTIAAIQANMKGGKPYYAHLYNDEELIVIFKDKVFNITPHISTWNEIFKYGRKVNIPNEQLDFWPNRFQDEIHYFKSEDFHLGTVDINRQLHNVFTGALSFLNQKEERFEFKFTDVTHRSLKFYREIVKILERSSAWSFQFIIEKKERTWTKTTFWSKYLECLSLIVKKFSENELIFVSDYLSKPKEETGDLLDIVAKERQVLNILQLESQGSLLLQAADILLGGIAYQKRIQSGVKTDKLKRELSNAIMQLLKNKKEQL